MEISMLLDDFHISDGKILKIESNVADLKLIFKDWTEKEWLIVFKEVLSVQSMSIGNEDLSQVRILESDTFKNHTMEYFPDEKKERFHSYNFYAARSENALLKIVATNEYAIIEL